MVRVLVGVGGTGVFVGVLRGVGVDLIARPGWLAITVAI
jgi:hypothetical protein